MHPLPDCDAGAWHRLQLAELGYTVVRGAIPAPLLEPMRRRLVELAESPLSSAGPDHARSPEMARAGREVRSLFEVEPLFEELMDLDPAYGICADALAGDITLGQGGLGHVLAPRGPAHVGWHRDGPHAYVRCTYLLSDVAEDGGPFTLMPGTHRCEQGPPPWFNAPDGRPREVPGMVRVTGAAGDCLINHTPIWHTNTPNRSDRPRLVAWVVYKAAAIPQWNGYGDGAYTVPRAVVARQTSPRRRALCAVDCVR